MLVLTRKSQQRIQIGSQITITILEVKGSSVRVGIEAPREVTVLRSELADRLKAEAAGVTEEMSIAPAKTSTARRMPRSLNPGEAGASSVPPMRLHSRMPAAGFAPLARHLSGSPTVKERPAASMVAEQSLLVR